jgi:hypothetical protein
MEAIDPRLISIAHEYFAHNHELDINNFRHLMCFRFGVNYKKTSQLGRGMRLTPKSNMFCGMAGCDI